MLPTSLRSVVIHYGTNNINTSSSDGVSLGVATVARFISHCHPNIVVIVSGLLPRDIRWSTPRVKIDKTNAYVSDYCKKFNKITFMRQDPDCTLSDNSLNMELYYKDYLHLIENGNIKFSKWIIETLQDVLSTQSSSQLLSSCLSQSSLIRLSPPSSLPRSNLFSVQTLSQSSSFQSLSATATPLNQKCQNFLLNSPTASPKLQTLTALPPFHQVFSSPLKTTSDHIPSAYNQLSLLLYQPMHLFYLILRSHLN